MAREASIRGEPSTPGLEAGPHSTRKLTPITAVMSLSIVRVS